MFRLGYQLETMQERVYGAFQREGSQKALDHVLEQTGGTLDAVFNNGAYAIPGAVEDIRMTVLHPHVWKSRSSTWPSAGRRH